MEAATEETALLPPPPRVKQQPPPPVRSFACSTSRRSLHCFNAAEISPRDGEDDETTVVGDRNRSPCRGARPPPALLLFVAAAVALLVVTAGAGRGSGGAAAVEPAASTSALVVVPGSLSDWGAGAGVVGAAPAKKAGAGPALGSARPDRPAAVTFQELAAERVPSLYRAACERAVPVLTEDVPPAGVYASRKLILKARDLLDVFGPVYPNATVLRPLPAEEEGAADAHAAPVDVWGLVRDLLDRGYEVIGEFQDIDHAHIRYTPEMLDEARGAVLRWRRDFDDFHRRYGQGSVLAFLQSPSPDSFRHRESRLFWKTIGDLPSGRDGASASLHVLGSRQTATALVYLSLAFQYDSVLGAAAHEHYHNLRKELRSMTDEYDLLGASMFPASCLPSIRLFKAARAILGDVNDMWTAYDAYLTHGVHRADEQRLAREVDRAWQSFRIWVEENDFEGAIRNVTRTMRRDAPASDDDGEDEGSSPPPTPGE
jgi:hypothetical protein